MGWAAERRCRLAGGAKRVAPERGRVRDDGSRCAARRVGTAQRRGRLDEERGGLALGARQIDVRRGEDDGVARSLDGAEERVHLRRHVVVRAREDSPRRTGLERGAEPLRQDRILARLRRQHALAEPDHANRREPEPRGASDGADVDRRLAEAAARDAQREQAIADHHERVGPGEPLAQRPRAGGRERLGEPPRQRRALARHEEPLVEEAAEGVPEGRERRSPDERTRDPDQRLQGRTNGAEVPERPLDPQRLARGRVLVEARPCERGLQLRGARSGTRRPLQRPLRARGVSAGGPERERELHRLAVRQVGHGRGARRSLSGRGRPRRALDPHGRQHRRERLR